MNFYLLSQDFFKYISKVCSQSNSITYILYYIAKKKQLETPSNLIRLVTYYADNVPYNILQTEVK